MIFIVITAIIVYFVLIAWTWKSLGMIEKSKKVAFILIGLILMYGITWIIIPKNEISHLEQDMQKTIQNMLVAIFTGINGIIIMPQMGKIVDKINEDEIKKEQVSKRIFIIVVIFIICVFFERAYIKDTQKGILKIYESNSYLNSSQTK